MKLRGPNSFFSQIWFRIVLTLLVTQVIVIAVFFLIGSVHVGIRLGTNASTLLRVVNTVFTQADPDLRQRVAEDINNDGYFKIIFGKVENTRDKLPYYPASRAAAIIVDQIWADKLIISYQANPEPMIWLQKNQPPLFALGVPFVGNKFIQRFSLVALLSLFLVALYMAWWVAKRISTPLHRLAEDAVKVNKASNSHYDQHLPHFWFRWSNNSTFLFTRPAF